MISAGIVAEFNPFHNGHKYLIEQAKKNADAVVVIMSGSFVQRGDIALTDKWTRACAALRNGADLIIELPVIYSMNTAQKFAYGAIKTLESTHVIDFLCFGSECGDINTLKHIAAITSDEPPEISEKIKKHIGSGLSYPTARSKAFSSIFGTHVLNTPNDILAVEYLKAITETGSSMQASAIKRIGTDHDSAIKSREIASASELRRMTKDGEDISAYVPAFFDFTRYDAARLDTALIYKLLTSSAEYISSINDVSEGLENKFISAARSCGSITELCCAVKSKRYTMSRIRRIAWSILLDLTKELCSLPPSYIRILGMNSTGRQLLRSMKDYAELPVIVKAADYKSDKIFRASNRAEDIFSLCCTDPSLRSAGRDLKTTPIIF